MNTVRSILHRTGMLQRIKYSFAGSIYLYLFRPELKKQAEKESGFYRSFLPHCKLIFDIGANDGHKTIVFRELAGKVVAVEPDPTNLQILNARFHRSRTVFIEPVAVTDKAGECELYIEKPGSALNSINPEWKRILEEENRDRWAEPIKFSGTSINVPAKTLDELIQKHGVPDFIKIDVEGNEKNVLKGLSHAINCISFEVLLPEFRQDAIDCMEMIHANNPRILFNYAVKERLMLDKFRPLASFREILAGLPMPHLEIIARAPVFS